MVCCSGPAAPAPAAPQWASDSSSVRLPAGPQYARGAVWRFFWGTHYRDIWAAPVTVPVLHLAAMGPGALVPVRAGGSYQSRTLRLRDATGQQFVLRSVDKDASAALPAGLRGLLGGLMKDQTSAGLPYGAYPAARLAAAAGVYHTQPRLVYLPDDPALGAFRAGYANALYLLEERAEGDQRGRACFGNSPAVVSTRDRLTALGQRALSHPEARAYLRARLLDMWLGDWSRREDQWRWASFPAAGGPRFRPIPRDRDQAFFRLDDGLLTQVVAWCVPKYQSFHATIPLGAVDGLTRTARALDRTLLATLGPEDYRQEADSLRRRLTDAVITDALHTVPAEVRTAVTARLAPRLRGRRAQLGAVAQRYYEVLAREAWLVGTDRPERFVVSSAGPGRVRVEIKAIRACKADSSVAVRLYDQRTTRQLELYGLGGNDLFELHRLNRVSMAVHLYGGAGRNQLIGASPQTAENVVWYTAPRQAGPRPPPGVTVEPDARPERTATAAGWRQRYNLRD